MGDMPIDCFERDVEPTTGQTVEQPAGGVPGEIPARGLIVVEIGARMVPWAFSDHFHRHRGSFALADVAQPVQPLTQTTGAVRATPHAMPAVSAVLLRGDILIGGGGPESPHADVGVVGEMRFASARRLFAVAKTGAPPC